MEEIACSGLVPLTSKALTILNKVIKEGTQRCPLYAVEYADTIIVTNNSWLLEWPKGLVHLSEKCLNRLFSKSKHKLAKPQSDNLLKNEWRDLVFAGSGKFRSVSEAEPNEEWESGKFYFWQQRELLQYNWTNIEATEMFIPDAEYKVYRRPDDECGVLRTLAVYNGDRLVGAFTNDMP